MVDYGLEEYYFLRLVGFVILCNIDGYFYGLVSLVFYKFKLICLKDRLFCGFFFLCCDKKSNFLWCVLKIIVSFYRSDDFDDDSECNRMRIDNVV